ncbi:MAG TPA: hypothetical protein VF389_11565 [Woeseiaceae bacterium]
MTAFRVNTKPRHRNAGRPPEKTAPGFLQWLRGRKCFIASHAPKHVCEGKVRACHFDPYGCKGMGTKVADRASMPMCDAAHGEQHRIGWQSFQRKYRFNGRKVVDAYWQAWPKRFAWERDHG